MLDKLERLIARIPNLDQELFEKTIESFPKGYSVSDLSDLRELVLARHGQLNSSHVVDMEDLFHKKHFINRRYFAEEAWDLIRRTKDTLEQLFPYGKYSIAHRVCSLEQAVCKEDKNGVRAQFDTIGFQVVPHHAFDMVLALGRMSAEKGWKTISIFNSFPFRDEEFDKQVGPNSSSYYRAVHYYIDVGELCVEVQFRTPVIDQWSKLHHATLYKPQISATQVEKEAVMEFGFIANWADLSVLN